VDPQARVRVALVFGHCSKAQIISTDYYPGAPDPLGLQFVVKVPASAR